MHSKESFFFFQKIELSLNHTRTEIYFCHELHKQNFRSYGIRICQCKMLTLIRIQSWGKLKPNEDEKNFWLLIIMICACKPAYYQHTYNPLKSEASNIIL